MHGVAWFADAPDAQFTTIDIDSNNIAKQQLLNYVNNIVSTINPAIKLNGSNADSAPSAKINPHISNKSYNEITDFNQDLIDLIATCQRHTNCSTSYCLRTKNGKQHCRYGYPKPCITTNNFTYN